MHPTILLPENSHFENVAGRIFYQQANNVVRLAWSAARIPLPALQEYYEQALALLLRAGSYKLLSFHGQRAPLSAAAQEWLTGDWIPRAISQAGARYCAIVEGADPMHRLSTQSVVAASPQGLEFRRFSSLDEANAWLTQVRG